MVSRKGKTYEEIFGVKKTQDIKKKMSEVRKGKIYTEEHREKISEGLQERKKRLGYVNSLETRKKMSESAKKRKSSEETKKKISKNNAKYFLGKHLSEETKIKIKIAKTGKHLSEETKEKISEAGKGRIVSEETRRKIGKGHKGKIISEETKIKLREARKQQIFPRYKTKPELKFIELIEKYNLPYKFVGNSKFWIENINPDFINCNNEKVCVEIFGDYWHNLPKMIKRDKKHLLTLKKYGWKRIVIWEHEVYNEKLVLSILNKQI